MTLSHWFRNNDMTPPSKTIGKTKVIDRVGQVDNHLRSVMLESNPNKLLRQRAGLDKGRIRRTSAVPRAYKMQQEYDTSRKQKALRVKKALRQLRQFHSHPVPNFSVLHRRWEHRIRLRQMHSLHKITEPQTPRTLLHSQRFGKKWKNELKSQQLKQQQQLTFQPKLGSKSFDSWRKRPFVPRIFSSIIKAQPFQLRSVERGKQRKQFDERVMQEQKSRWRLKAVEWALSCQDEYVQARKQTRFKARPNPWKRTRATN